MKTWPIDDFINQYHDTSVIDKMKQLYTFIFQLEPGFEQAISYGIPTFKINGKNVVHFGPGKKHIGLYPGASGISNFAEKFEKMGLKYSKGAVQFPLDKPLPLDLIKQIVEFRLNEEKSKLN